MNEMLSSETTPEQDYEDVKAKIQEKYFAAAEPDLIAGVLSEKLDDWMKYVESSAHFKKMQKSYHMYFGMGMTNGPSSSEIRQAGPSGQYSLVYLNEYRNLIKHIYNMITQQKVAYDCRGANTDSETTESCQLGNGVLDWYLRDKKVARYLKRACEYGCFLSEGFVDMEWDHDAGTIYTYDQAGRPKFNGDVVLGYRAPWDVVKDHWRRDEDMPWCMVIRWKNRYNLAAKFPEMADEILSVDAENLWRYRERFQNRAMFTDTDLAPEITFYHEPSPALPKGRRVVFMDSNTKLFDGDLPYKRIPVYRCAPDHLAETPHGYTFAFDLLGPQELANLLDSIAATNQKLFGGGVMKLPEGHNMSHLQIAEGFMAMIVNEKNGKAEPMKFPGTPAEVFNFRQMISQKMEVIAGVNSVIRGQPDQNIKAGNFAALIAAQAYQFSNQLQESFTEISQDVGQGLMEFLQTFAKAERTAKIVGKNNRYMMKSFTGQGLGKISSVMVEVGNAAGKTVAGRMQMAQDGLQNGLIKTFDRYLQVVETGKLEHVTENEQNELNTVIRENEMLRQGINPPVMNSDNPIIHFHQHKALIDDPEIRQNNPQLVQVVTEHLLQHFQQYTQMSPVLAQVLGIPPAAMPMMVAPGAPGAGGNMAANAETGPQGAMPGMPQPPPNPVTAEPSNAPLPEQQMANVQGPPAA